MAFELGQQLKSAMVGKGITTSDQVDDETYKITQKDINGWLGDFRTISLPESFTAQQKATITSCVQAIAEALTSAIEGSGMTASQISDLEEALTKARQIGDLSNLDEGISNPEIKDGTSTFNLVVALNNLYDIHYYEVGNFGNLSFTKELQTGTTLNIVNLLNYLRSMLGNKANTSDIPTKLSDLSNDLNFLTEHQDISNKVDKESGKGLSTNDYTNDDKAKVASAITSHQDISGKQDKISDLDSIRSGASLGATALQSFTETDPTVPSWAKAESKPTYAASEVGAIAIESNGIKNVRSLTESEYESLTTKDASTLYFCIEDEEEATTSTTQE